MTKADIASLVAEKGLTKKQAMEAVEATLEIIKSALRRGDKIQLVGVGSFQVKAKRARKGRNPQTGSEITITARKVLKFKPGKALHQTVNAAAATQAAASGNNAATASTAAPTCPSTSGTSSCRCPATRIP